MTPQDTAAMLAHLGKAGLRYTPQIDEHLASTWYSQLREVNADNGLEAVGRWIGNNEDFPTVADLIKLTKVIKAERRARALPAQGERAGYRCKCLDVGMVEVQGQHDAWRPCKDCNWEGFAKWEAGEYETKVFRAVLDPCDVEASRVQLEGVRAVLAASKQTKRPRRAV